MTILRENLIAALEKAINQNFAEGNGRTIQTQGWQEFLVALRDGTDFVVVTDPNRAS